MARAPAEISTAANSAMGRALRRSIEHNRYFPGFYPQRRASSGCWRNGTSSVLLALFIALLQYAVGVQAARQWSSIHYAAAVRTWDTLSMGRGHAIATWLKQMKPERE
jgi:hypothetical protein